MEKGIMRKELLPGMKRCTRVQRALTFFALGVALAALGCGKTQPEKLFVRAAKAQARGEYAAAIKAFETYLSKYPNHGMAPIAHMRIGMARKALGDVPGALKAYEEMSSSARDPHQRILAQKKIRDTYCENRNWGEALRVGKDLIASATGAEKVNQMLRWGEILWKSGEKEQAEDYFRKSAAGTKHPAARAGFLITLANFLRSAGDVDRCTRLYDEVARDPSLPAKQRIAAYTHKGTVLYYSDRPQEAVETFEDIKRTFPDDFETCVRADTMIAQIEYKKESDRVDASLDRIVAACSDRIASATDPALANRFRLLLADAFQKVERYAQAQDTFETVKNESPEGSGHWRIADKRISEIGAELIRRSSQDLIR
jgi:tetratricopeptide (TPR) repeat protein